MGSSSVAYNLGNLLNSQGYAAGAERAYQKAIDFDLDLAQIKDIVWKGLREKMFQLYSK